MAIWRVSVGEYERLYDISDDGRHILFGSGISDIGEPGGEALLGYDLDTVTGDRQPILVDLVSPLVGSSLYGLDADGDASVIAFAEQSGSLVPGDTNGTQDVFVLDRGTGAVVRASTPADGTEADAAPGGPLLSGNGREVFFSSAATNLVPGDGNGLTDVFVRDLDTGALINLTPSRDSDTAGLHFAAHAASDDGSKLLLVADVSGAGTFLLDRAAGGSVVRLSEQGNSTSTYAFITDLSADGRVALLPGDDGELVLRDLENGNSTVLAHDYPVWASISSDGRFAAFVSAENGLVPDDTDDAPDIFLFDHLDGETWRVSLDENGEPFAGRGGQSDFGFSGGKVETAPGGGFPIIAFNSALPLTDGDTAGMSDVYAIEVNAIAVADRSTTAPGTPVHIDVLANDIDLDGAAPTIAGVGPVTGGTAVVEGDAIAFTPDDGSAEAASFSYTLEDGEGNQSQAVVRVHVVEEGPLVVTTAEDLVANDGQLSLREAVEAANARAGADVISFAEHLRGSTLHLQQGALEVTDDLVVDGDPEDRGAAGISFAAVGQGSYSDLTAAGLRVVGADLRLEDLTVTISSQHEYLYEIQAARGIASANSNITLLRSAVTGLYGYQTSEAIRMRGGSLLVQSSEISDIGGHYDSRGIVGEGTIRVVDSRISGIRAQEIASGIGGEGQLFISNTEISNINGEYSDGVSSSGDTVITGSTIDGVSGLGIAGLTVDGTFSLSNSTITGVSGERYSGGVVVGSGGHGTISNVTIAGNGSAGLVVEDGAEVRLQNNLILGNTPGDQFSGFVAARDIIGIVISNGHNIFGQDNVDGAVAGDLTGVQVRDVFAVLDTSGRPVVTNNGGPTPTMALLDTPDNPALGAADPTLAPELDQRGFPRVGAPDVGSFEAGHDDGTALDGLPPLAEKVPVDPSLINGVDADLLRGDGVTPFTITFLHEAAARDSAIGYYLVDEDNGSGGPPYIFDVGILFASTHEAIPGTGVQVEVQDGYRLGLFLIAGGADLNGGRLADNPNLSFYDEQGNSATVAEPVPSLFIDDSIGSAPVAGQVLHASDYVEGDEGNVLNPNGSVRTLSAPGESGGLLVAWDDRTSGADLDFNDVIVRIDGPGLGLGNAALPASVSRPDFML